MGSSLSESPSYYFLMEKELHRDGNGVSTACLFALAKAEGMTGSSPNIFPHSKMYHSIVCFPSVTCECLKMNRERTQ